MKRLGLFFALMVMLLPAGKSRAQSVSSPFVLQVPAGESLQQAVERLASDYHIDFAYAPEVLARQQVGPAFFSAPDLETLLQQLLTNLPIQYRIVSDDRILLRGITFESAGPLQSSLSFSGRIVDAADGQPIVNVAIALDTLNLGALSDEKGAFSLSLPSGLQGHSLWVYHLGYKSREIPLAGYRPGQTIHLQPEPMALNEVVIVEQLPSIAARLGDGSVTLRDPAIQGNLAAQLAGKDIFRQIQMLPGISADDDLSSEIRIRGSNADETLIILDGMPLYKVDHFYGVFSALNSSYLEEVNLYKNAMPIQYGGRTGGLLLLRSANEIRDLSGSLDLNLLSAAAKVNVPLSPSLGLSLSGRGSHVNVASSKFFDWVSDGVDNYTEVNSSVRSRSQILATQPDFGFSDWNAKLIFSPGSRHRLALNFYHSQDDYLNSFFSSFDSRFNQERITNEQTFEDRQDWQNTGSSIQYQAQLSHNWRLAADGFYTRYQFAGALSSEIVRSAPRLGSVSLSLSNDQDNKVENAGYRLILSKELGAGQIVQFGSSLNRYRTDFIISSEVDTLLSSRGQSFDAQVFSNYQWSPLEKLQLSLGGRLNYYRETRGFYFSPRITGTYMFDSGFSLKSSYSINYQFMREITHENRLGQSVDLVLLSNDEPFPVGRSHNYMLGANYRGKNWWLDVELYHKTLANVIDHSSVNPTFGGESTRPGRRQNYRLFVGEGQVNGLDVAFGWESGKYNSYVAYTLSKAINRFAAIQRGAAVPARDDRRHQLKWINTYDLGRFELSGNFIYSSGKPYYDLRLIPPDQSDRRREFVRWLPSYQRLDLGLAYNFSIGGTRAKLGASVFNVTNNANVKYLQFIYSISSEENNQAINTIIGSQTDLLDRTLNLSFGLEF